MEDMNMASFDDAPLPPAIAAEMMKRDPTSVMVDLSRLPSVMGLTEDDLLRELRSGRLVGHGQRRPDGSWARFGVTGAELIRWLSAGSRVAQKARKHLAEIKPDA